MNGPRSINILTIVNALDYVIVPQSVHRLVRLKMRRPLTTRGGRESITDLASNDPPLVVLIVAQCALKPR